MSDDFRDVIAAFNKDIARIEKVSDPEKRLLQSMRIAEAIIKEHFTASPERKVTLGSLLFFRKKFLRDHLSDVRFAIDVRNRMSHHSSNGLPTIEEMKQASVVLLRITRLHVQELGRLNGIKSDPLQIEKVSSPEKESVKDVEEQRNSQDQAAQTLFDPKVEQHASQIQRSPIPQLNARDDDPHLSASTLAEYTFCPRAGLVTHEGSLSVREDELPSLGLLPWYEEKAIEEALKRSLVRLFSLGMGFVAVVMILSLWLSGKTFFPIILSVGISPFIYLLIREYSLWRELNKRQFAANFAIVCEPDPDSTAFQAVDWWGLLKAGFDVRRPEKAFVDTNWKLSGKPRRILQKGSMTIPVHRIRAISGPLAPQHIVRAMVLCHLVEASEGAVCPFAVILYGNTYQGTTVPNTLNHREQMYSVLERVRDRIKASDACEWEPPKPVHSSICYDCPHGRPRPVSLKEFTPRYDKSIKPYELAGKKENFHCDCGDRFLWMPGHKRNQNFREAR